MLQEQKNLRQYNKEILIDPLKPGRLIQRVYAGAKYYDNKLGLGDGVKGFRKPDTVLAWDATKRGWSFQFHSYQPFIPEYADGILEYRDLFKEKDQLVGFRALCGHVKGVLVPSIEGVTDRNAILYENAYGEGIDLIVAFTFRKMLRLVRIREGFRPKVARFSFEIMTAEKIQGAKALPGAPLEPIPNGKTKTERIVVGESPDFNTYINTFRVWDSGKVTAPGTGTQVEIVPITIDRTDQSVIIHKEIPQEFLDKAVGDVFTDDVTQYTEDKDTYYGTSFTTGGAPNATTLNVGGWGDFYYSWIEWDLTSTPDGGFTTECTFNIKVAGVAANNNVGTLRRITSSWTEAGVTLAAHPTEDATTIASLVSPITIGAGNWDQQSILALYQAWKAGTYSNYGVKIHSTGNSNAANTYYSSDQGGADIPYLEITYQLGADMTLGMEYFLTGQDLFNITLRGMADAFDITFENTPTDVTKGLVYAVAVEHTVTKGLAYSVVAPAEVTKGLTYAVKTTPAEITKDLAYAVATSVAITKGLTYAVVSQAELTQGLEYEVVSSQVVTKGLAYTIKAPQALTKNLVYTVQTAGSITKGLDYTVNTATELTQGLVYAVTLVTEQDVTKGLNYAVQTILAITKGIIYSVKKKNPITKGLQYKNRVKRPTTKGLIYMVKTAFYKASYDDQNYTYDDVNLSYSGFADDIAKGLKYTVKVKRPTTKGLSYAIETTGAITKGLTYHVLTEQDVTKGMQYSVLTEGAITKGIEYQIVQDHEITRGLMYAIITEPSVMKGLTYQVRTEQSIVKGLAYFVLGSAEITRGLDYRILTTHAQSKGLQYRIHITHTIDRGMTYSVVVEGGVTKGLKYTVKTEHAITKGMEYVLHINPYCPLDTPYTAKTSPYSGKSSPFTSKQSPYTGKEGIYTPLPGRHCN